MALDYLAFSRIITLIKDKIVDGKILKINQISNEEFLFLIRNNNQNLNLLVSTHPNMSYLNLVGAKPESNHLSTPLLMLLRKYLENGKIGAFEQQNDDRVVLLKVLNRDDYFRNTCHQLYIELIGRASNLILTDKDNLIIDSLKKIPLEYSNIRTILPGIHYTLPDKPISEKVPFDLENEIEYRGISLEKISEEISLSNKIYITSKDNKKDFHFIPFTYLQGEVKAYNFNEGLDAFYDNALLVERHRQFTSEMDKLARLEIKKADKKVKKLVEELEIAKDSSRYKYYGDLLLTYMQGCIINDNKVTIFDEENKENVIIDYNPNLNLYTNANNYYKKYQKAKVALVKIQEQIDICKETIEYFTAIQFQLLQADFISASQIKEELSELGYFRRYQRPVKNKNNKKKEKEYRPLAFKVDGINIYAGQNNLQNEYLTFKMANKSHMFLHVKDGPGSHVVIFSDHVDANLLKIGALIAAYYSSYQASSTVPINYTLVKNIKKIPGGKIGKVIINNYKTIYVDPDYSLISKYKV